MRKRQTRLIMNVSILFAFGSALVLCGCSMFTSPYNDKQTYVQGSKPPYDFASIFNPNGKDKPILGKIILTTPASNLSYQFYKYKADGTIESVVTCVSPAEVAMGLGVTGSASLTGSTNASSSVSVTASGSQATSESITPISSNAAAQYVATSSFYNCMAYASGIYGTVGTPDATKNAGAAQEEIFVDAIKIQQATFSNVSSTKKAVPGNTPPAKPKPPAKPVA
jgi:hypothetical protein